MKKAPELTVSSVLDFLRLDGAIESGMERSIKCVYNRRRTGFLQTRGDGIGVKATGLVLPTKADTRARDETVKKLRAFYAPHDKELFRLLGRKLW